MIEEQGVIVAVEPLADKGSDANYIFWVETQIKTTCSACHVEENCGTSTVAKAFSKRKNVVSVASVKQANVGQQVKIGIPENTIVTGSLMVYMLPLVLAILAAVVVDFTAQRLLIDAEWLTILGLFAGGTMGFAFARWWIKNGTNASDYQVTLLQILPEHIPIKEV
ncbi:SoxR reducing system RseC family protein [Flocculibacter collagenilyticus]|uniref:SoxR reducing system RseC family protein n=1 Tax=Flocculibacter collagenilyticus TaxID=2744479 RepID=UPI0018F6ABA9|nr:SoxR reducing system RseC family protein [Flocculibacter collagenilyticus]